jgi:signal transduction histidine kinase
VTALHEGDRDTTAVNLLPSPPSTVDRPGAPAHLLQFYESEDFLADVVADFLGAGLGAGDRLAIIASAAHQDLFAGRLRARGFDPAAARDRGQLVCLDARETLATLMVDGMPSGERLEAIVGSALLTEKSSSGRMRAYGEMVDLLWTQGNARAALALEDLWNELQRRHPVDLLCAYTLGSFFTRASGLHEVCGRHGQLLGLQPAASPPGEAELPAAQYSREVRDAAALRAERLMRITAAIADAVSGEHVFHAVVDEVAAALGASSAGLWLVSEDGQRGNLVRALGYNEQHRPSLDGLPLSAAGQLPVIDCLRAGEPIWISSQDELLQRYAHLRPMVTPGRLYRIACLPMIVRGKTIGALAFTFDDAPPIAADQRDFLLLVTRYSGQALERLRLLEVERSSRAQAEAARVQAELLHRLAGSLIEANCLEQVFEPALDAIVGALGTRRCAVLLYDDEKVMRFRAWRGLSETYRAAVEGHSPWSPDEHGPQPIVVADCQADPALAVYRELFRREEIGALAFFPLATAGRLLGKFMVYYDQPRSPEAQEVELATAIANHVAAACARFASLAELERTVRFNEMFTAILGHDLRNPLGAIMAAAQLAQRRQENDKLARPLARIVSSGQRMARMIDQLLDFTRVRVGAGLPLQPGPADLMSVLRQVSDELEHGNPGWHLHLQLQGEGTGCWDVDRLSQVFSNLIGNAIQHGQMDSGVKIRADGSSPEAVRLEVQNMGTIPPGLVGKLFEPMAGGEKKSERSSGLGLGLYISRQIVEAHGGSISVHSDEVEGTRFTVTLPRQPAGSPAPSTLT